MPLLKTVLVSIAVLMVVVSVTSMSGKAIIDAQDIDDSITTSTLAAMILDENTGQEGGLVKTRVRKAGLSATA